jgi:hypothetical protein
MNIPEMKVLVGQYRRVFTGKDGEAVLADLKKRGFFSQTTFSESYGRMGFNEGRRSLVVHIENMKQLDPDKLTELPREYAQ